MTGAAPIAPGAAVIPAWGFSVAKAAQRKKQFTSLFTIRFEIVY